MSIWNYTAYTGSLQPKKKSELQAIAKEMGLTVGTTKDDIISVIKTHMAENKLVLIEDLRFCGLYARKPRSARKTDVEQSADADSDDSAAPSVSASVSRRGPPKKSIERTVSPAITLTRTRAAMTPSSHEDEIPSSPASVSRSTMPPPPAPLRPVLSGVVAKVTPEAESVVAKVENTTDQLNVDAERAFAVAKNFLSNSPNIASITVLIELCVLLVAFIPWQSHSIPFTGSSAESSFQMTFTHPPISVFVSRDLYKTLIQWAFPTIFLPQLVGLLVSFSDRHDASVDPVSAGIIRLACVSAGSWGITEDLLSTRLRVISAATALAFAFAEAVNERKGRREVERLLFQ